MAKEKKYKWAVYMGRMQPPHTGHCRVMAEAFEQAENLIVLVGGAETPRTAKNPWTFMERLHMILRSVDYLNTDNLFVGTMHDHPYNDSGWAEEVRRIVAEFVAKDPGTVALVGHHKDASSYYLDLFPEWKYIEVPNYQSIDATTIRDVYFSHPHVNILESGVPEPVRDFLRKFSKTEDYTRLAEEHAHIKRYKAIWSHSPFPPTFNTVDIAVLHDFKLLCIKRGGCPGKGLLALPGGFIDVGERLVESARRELLEETCITFSSEEFKKRLIEVKVFDHPGRSQIGRVVTHMHVINANGLGVVEQAMAADDAAEVVWIPIEELDSLREKFASDHYYMARYAVDAYEEKLGL